MAKVSLRAYNREIESLIEQGHQLDEAVAHCRHILTTYPKHLDTYRLLGKAYLEAKRYDQAVDIFQRVLVTAPEDFVSHVGMSIIADDQGKLDEAIWHMERAFEVQPSNAAIQAELQRLFGRRDGVEPPKIRLTRGALAHMYVQGELYTQAISEIRAVLAHDKDRTDMQALLARAYFRNGQKAEAAEACSALLAISPYCLDANRLMAEILPGTQASDAAREHRRRVIELDPYTEFAQGSIFSTDTVADGAVALQRLEYTGQPSGGGPAVAPGLGTTLGVGQRSDSPPPWLASAREAAGPTAEEAAPEGVPDFLREAGWTQVDSSQSEPTGAGEAISGDEAAAVPGDLPEWVRALAPSEESGAQIPAQDSAWQSPEWTNDVAANRPGAAPATGTARAADETPDWLRNLARGTEARSDAAITAAPSVSAGHPVPSQVIGDLGTTAREQDDALAWLEGLAEKHGAKPEELLTPPEARPETAPDWVDRARQLGEQTAQSWAPIDDGAGVTAPVAKESEQKPFDWLSGLSDKNTYAAMEEKTEADQPPILEERDAAGWPRREGGSASEELPDWLGDDESQAPEKESGVAREPKGAYESSVALPDWLADLDKQKEISSESTGPPGHADKLPDWLRTEASPQPEPAGTQASDWLPAESGAGPTGQQRLGGDEAADAVIRDRAPEPLGWIEPEPVKRTLEPLPSRTRPVPAMSTISVPSVGGAKAELGRGNIAAALDLYGKLIRKGRSLEEIIRDLRDALYRYPVEVPIWQALGDAYMRANRLQEALDAYTKAEELLR